MGPLVVVFLVVTIAIGGWLTGQWLTGGVDPDSVHPGYFLPTAAGGLISAFVAWIAYRTVVLAVRRQLFPLRHMAEPAAQPPAKKSR